MGPFANGDSINWALFYDKEIQRMTFLSPEMHDKTVHLDDLDLTSNENINTHARKIEPDKNLCMMHEHDVQRNGHIK